MNKKYYPKVFIIIFLVAATILFGMIVERRNSVFHSYFTNSKTTESSVSDNSDNLGVNINSDDIGELTRLNGIGEKTARRIIEYRREHGDFEVKEDIMRVPGIGEKRFDNLKDYIYIR